MTSSKLVKIINYALLALGMIILAFFISTVDLKQIKTVLSTAGFRIIFILILLSLPNPVVKAIRWQLMVAKMSKKRIGFWFSLSSIFAGSSSASILPGRNEITKPLMLKTSYKAKLSQTIPASFIEKIFDFFGVILTFFIALAFVAGIPAEISKYIVIFVILIIVFLLVLFVFPHYIAALVSWIIEKLPLPSKLVRKVDEANKTFFDTFSVLKHKNVAVIVLFLSFIANVADCIRIYYLFLLLGMPITLATACIAFSGSITIGVLAVIPGGVGVTEFSAAYLIKLLQPAINFDQTKLFIFMDRIVSYYLVVVVGALVLLIYQKMPSKKKH